MNRTLMFFVALLFLFGGLMIFYLLATRGRDAAPEDPVVAEPTEPIEDFVLTDQAGQKFDSKSLEGKIWVGSIFFATCPSTCRLQNMRVAELQQRFGDKGVEFVSITCDPDNDTPAALNDYSKKFGAQEDRWHFLTGDIKLIKQIGGEKFGITVDDKVHSDRLILFDKTGESLGSYRSIEPDQFEQLVDELKQLVGEDDADQSPPADEAA